MRIICNLLFVTYNVLMQDASPGCPILVFLSPGVDVAVDVEALGYKMGFTHDNGKYFSVSLGQGQVR